MPAAANSGQYVATGRRDRARPRSASMWAASATTPFVEDQTLTIVSCCHGRPGAASPPQRSTTRPAADDHATAGSDVAAAAEVLDERLLQRPERRVACAVDEFVRCCVAHDASLLVPLSERDGPCVNVGNHY